MDKKMTTVPRVVTALLLILAGSPALAEQRAIFLGNPEWLTNGIYDPIKKVFEEKGYKMEVMTLPCDADLGCWRQMSDNDPAWFKPFVAEAARKLTNCECVLVGTSRAGFFALQIAAKA